MNLEREIRGNPVSFTWDKWWNEQTRLYIPYVILQIWDKTPWLGNRLWNQINRWVILMSKSNLFFTQKVIHNLIKKCSYKFPLESKWHNWKQVYKNYRREHLESKEENTEVCVKQISYRVRSLLVLKWSALMIIQKGSINCARISYYKNSSNSKNCKDF